MISLWNTLDEERCLLKSVLIISAMTVIVVCFFLMLATDSKCEIVLIFHQAVMSCLPVLSFKNVFCSTISELSSVLRYKKANFHAHSTDIQVPKS